jgi:protein-S-isoprenylcysteine O-methyltransferase Ste14
MLGYQREESVGISAPLRSDANASFPWWLSASVILGALLMAAGGVIALVRPAMLVSPDAQIDEAARVYAGYLVSRNLALAAMLLVMLGVRARGPLRSLMLLTACIQLLDAGMDSLEGRWTLVPGVLVFAIVFFIGAARISGQPFWKLATWRDEPRQLSQQ